MWKCALGACLPMVKNLVNGCTRFSSIIDARILAGLILYRSRAGDPRQSNFMWDSHVKSRVLYLTAILSSVLLFHSFWLLFCDIPCVQVLVGRELREMFHLGLSTVRMNRCYFKKHTGRGYGSVGKVFDVKPSIGPLVPYETRHSGKHL